MDNLAWNGIPDIRTLYNIIDKRAQPLNLIICLPDYKIPDFQTAQDASDGECRLKHRLEQALQCLQFNSINLIEHILPDVRFWLVPPSRTNRLHEHFQHISWQCFRMAGLWFLQGKRYRRRNTWQADKRHRIWQNVGGHAS